MIVVVVVVVVVLKCCDPMFFRVKKNVKIWRKMSKKIVTTWMKIMMR